MSGNIVNDLLFISIQNGPYISGQNRIHYVYLVCVYACIFGHLPLGSDIRSLLCLPLAGPRADGASTGNA